MSLILERVELSNIRAHKHLVIEFQPTGVTAISGANGKGKSTIVDSIAWALYGTKPTGISKVSAIYNDKAVWGKDKCFARIDLLVDNVPYRIERRMVTKGGGVECEVFKKDESDNWANVAGPSVSHSSPFIREILKSDEKGFLASTLIQQKQVDQLITSSPRERGLVVEKLTGITSITEGIIHARQEFNTLKQALALHTTSPGETDALQKQKETLEQELEGARQEFTEVSEKAKLLKVEGTELKKRVEDQEEANTMSAEAREKLSAVQALIKSSEARLEKLLKDKDSAKAELSSLVDQDNVPEMRSQIDALREKKVELSTDISGLRNTITEATSQLSQCIATIDAADDAHLLHAQKDLGAARAKLVKLETATRELQTRRQRAETSIERLENAISVISDSEDGECPTCLQKVSNVDLAVDSLRKEIEQFGADGAKLQQECAANELLVANENARIEDLSSLVSAFETKENLDGQIKEAKVAGQKLKGELKALDGELKTLEGNYEKARQNELKSVAYSKLLKDCQTLATEIDNFRTEEIQAKEAAKATVSPSKLAADKRKLNSTREEYLTSSNRVITLKGIIALLEEKLENLTVKIIEAKAALKKNADLLKSVEAAKSTISVLEEFRSNRVESSVPLIEAYASDFLGRFTEGMFTQLRLNNKFEASVVLAEGTTRAIGLLSGGELSAAALALRLAISKVLDGGANHSLIIMDEVLVSQDLSRAELILSSVKDICNGQTILIAHNDSIHDYADNLVEL